MTTSIRLSLETEQRLSLLAQQTGHTKSFFLRELIESGLDELEDYYQASQVLDRIKQGAESVYSLEEAEKLLGLST
jgi:RHH-type rel operon transcriptional repressor/antitoxin RelB